MEMRHDSCGLVQRLNVLQHMENCKSAVDPPCSR